MLPPPVKKPDLVCKPDEFIFADAYLDHGHIYGQCHGLILAGGTLKWVYDPNPDQVAKFLTKHPGTRVARDYDEILADPEVQMVAAAAIPSERAAIGQKAMRAGKHYFTDKTPFTTLEQLEESRAVHAQTGKKYMVYYGERLCSEAGIYAGDLIAQGLIGRVIQVMGMGPHRLGAANRPDWFFRKQQYGGILTDIGSHQCEQFLHYAGASEATVLSARVENFNNPEHPELEDFGEASLVADNGASNYQRVDWFTPAGLTTWGDGRTFILGTEGYIELRKNLDLARDTRGSHLFLANGSGEFSLNVQGQVGAPFFGELILDCLNGTSLAMTQAHAFKAAELALKCQEIADARRCH